MHNTACSTHQPSSKSMHMHCVQRTRTDAVRPVDAETIGGLVHGDALLHANNVLIEGAAHVVEVAEDERFLGIKAAGDDVFHILAEHTLSVCVCVCVCTYVFVYIYIYIYIYIYMCVCVCVCCVVSEGARAPT